MHELNQHCLPSGNRWSGQADQKFQPLLCKLFEIEKARWEGAQREQARSPSAASFFAANWPERCEQSLGENAGASTKIMQIRKE
jgi:hypothetical protein